MTLTPPIILPTEGRRWLEEYAVPPRNKVTCRKMRHALLDGVLLTLRAQVTLAVTSLMGYGEGAIILMGVLSPEVCAAAYR